MAKCLKNTDLNYPLFYSTAAVIATEAEYSARCCCWDTIHNIVLPIQTVARLALSFLFLACIIKARVVLFLALILFFLIGPLQDPLRLAGGEVRLGRRLGLGRGAAGWNPEDSVCVRHAPGEGRVQGVRQRQGEIGAPLWICEGRYFTLFKKKCALSDQIKQTENHPIKFKVYDYPIEMNKILTHS